MQKIDYWPCWLKDNLMMTVAFQNDFLQHLVVVCCWSRIPWCQQQWDKLWWFGDPNSPCHNCNVLVTEWDQWQDITYLWRQLMMWSVGWLWFPGDHYLPYWPMTPRCSFYEWVGYASQNVIGNSWFMLVQYRAIWRPSSNLWPRLEDASSSIPDSSRTLTAYLNQCRTLFLRIND